MEEQKDFVVFGDASNNNIFNQRKYKVIPEVSKKKQIEKLYIKDDVALYISNGELIKEGKFEFEKKYNQGGNSTKTPVYFKINNILTQPIISQVSFGDNHVVIMSLQGQVFTWGENYFGQLGQGNPFVVICKEPALINKLDIASSIYAYGNNSFIISATKRLWVWGSSKYLGTEFRGNLFRPFQSQSNYLFHKLKINNGTFIAKATITQESLSNIGDNKTEQNKNKNKETPDNLENNSGNDGYLLDCMKKIDKLVNDLIYKYDNQSYVLEELRTTISDKKLSLDKKFLVESFNSIKKLFNDDKFFINKALDKQPVITNNKIIEIFTTIINSTIQSSISKLRLDEVIETIINLEKDSLKTLKEVSSYDFKDSKEIKQRIQIYIVRLKSLIKNYMDYKKLEFISHYLAALEHLFSLYNYSKILAMIKEDIIDIDDDIFRKIFIIERLFDSMKYLEENITVRIHKLESSLGNVSKLNIKELNEDDDGYVTKLVYKYMIDSFNRVKTIWSLNCQSIEGVFIQKEKINHMTKVKTSFNYLYGIHQYLHTISIIEPLENFFNRDNNLAPRKENDYLFNTIVKCLSEVEYCVNKLTQLLNMKKENKNNSDHFSNEMIVMYASSILDQGYIKRILLILCYSILQSKKKLLADESIDYERNDKGKEMESKKSLYSLEDY